MSERKERISVCVLLVAGAVVVSSCLSFFISWLVYLGRVDSAGGRVYEEDTNQDGCVDKWWLEFKTDEPFGLDYVILDEDFDGMPNTRTIGITGGYGVLRWTDAGEDGIPDRLQIALPDRRHEALYLNYHDLDMDGNLDMLVHMDSSTRKVLERRILVGDVWTSVLLEEDTRRPDEVFVQGDDGQPRKLVFREGCWRGGGGTE